MHTILEASFLASMSHTDVHSIVVLVANKLKPVPDGQDLLCTHDAPWLQHQAAIRKRVGFLMC